MSPGDFFSSKMTNFASEKSSDVFGAPAGAFFSSKMTTFPSEKSSDVFGAPAGAFFSAKNDLFPSEKSSFGLPLGCPWLALGCPWLALGALGSLWVLWVLLGFFWELNVHRLLCLSTKSSFLEHAAGSHGSRGSGVKNCGSEPTSHTRRGPG